MSNCFALVCGSPVWSWLHPRWSWLQSKKSKFYKPDVFAAELALELAPWSQSWLHRSAGPSTRAAVKLLPEALEATARDASVVHGVAWIAMAEVILNGPQVSAAIGEIIPAGMSQHVWMQLLQADAFSGR